MGADMLRLMWFALKAHDTADLKDAKALLEELKRAALTSGENGGFGSIFRGIADADSGPFRPENCRFGLHARYQGYNGPNFRRHRRRTVSQ